MAEDRPMPNAALRVLFEAIEEVMGENGVKAVLNAGGLQRYINNYPPANTKMEVTFSEYGHAEQAVEDFYGPRGARAMLIRIGRALFQYGLKEQPGLRSLGGLALKALPMNTAMKLVLDNIAKAGVKDINQPVHLEEDEENFYLVAEECMCRWRGKKEKPCCFVTVGVLREALHWATGQGFDIEEIKCIATGDQVCRYRIPKTPQD
jgi:predicted hydrocarbon binding protein